MRKSSLRALHVSGQCLGALEQRNFKSCLHRQGCVNRCVSAWVPTGREGNRRQNTSDGGIKGKHVLVCMVLLPLQFSALQLRNRLLLPKKVSSLPLWLIINGLMSYR